MVGERGQVAAEEATPIQHQKRPRLSLFSDIYQIKQMPIRHLILDEAQYVKNWETANHQSIKGLYYKKLLAVTGTPISNRWWDIYGILHLMNHTPLTSPHDFFPIIGNPYLLRAEPPPSKLARLVKFLMMLTVSLLTR